MLNASRFRIHFHMLGYRRLPRLHWRTRRFRIGCGLRENMNERPHGILNPRLDSRPPSCMEPFIPSDAQPKHPKVIRQHGRIKASRDGKRANDGGRRSGRTTYSRAGGRGACARARGEAREKKVEGCARSRTGQTTTQSSCAGSARSRVGVIHSAFCEWARERGMTGRRGAWGIRRGG